MVTPKIWVTNEDITLVKSCSHENKILATLSKKIKIKILAILMSLTWEIVIIKWLLLKNISFVGWKSPPSEFYKLNLDGFAYGNTSRALANGLIRDSHGSWIRSLP